MKTKLTLLLISILSITMVRAESVSVDAAPIVLTPTGYPYTRFNLPKDQWLALAWKNNTWQLVSTTPLVRYQKSEDTTVISSPVRDTFVLIRAKNLRPGLVKIVGGDPIYSLPKGRTIDDPCALRAPCRQQYELDGKKYEIALIAIGGDQNQGQPPTTGKFVLRQLSPKRIEQEVLIVKEPAMNFWKIDVVGDLDGDGTLKRWRKLSAARI